MANTILTHQMVAREAVKMFVEDTFIKTINTGRSDEFKEQVNGYKKGNTVRIDVPATPVVFNGATFANGGNAPDFTEGSVNLTLDTQKHVPLTFSAQEKLLNITEFKSRILAPAMQALLSTVQADLLTRMKNQTPNVVGTWGSIPNTRTTYAQARARLEKRLAPKDLRSVQFTSDANLALAEANATLFNPNSQISEEFLSGAVGEYANFAFFENQSMPLQTNGAGAGYLVGAGSQTGSSIAVITGTGTITAGSIVTFQGVNAVHPITGADAGYLMQFVVTADLTGPGNLQIFPALIPTSSTVIGTVTASPAANAPVSVFGTASTSAIQNLAYQKNAFTAAFAPLPVLASCEGYTATMQGVSVRVMTFGDGLHDLENTRIDVLYGEAVTRWQHSVRITQ